MEDSIDSVAFIADAQLLCQVVPDDDTNESANANLHHIIHLVSHYTGAKSETQHLAQVCRHSTRIVRGLLLMTSLLGNHLALFKLLVSMAGGTFDDLVAYLDKVDSSEDAMIAVMTGDAFIEFRTTFAYVLTDLDVEAALQRGNVNVLDAMCDVDDVTMVTFLITRVDLVRDTLVEAAMAAKVDLIQFLFEVTPWLAREHAVLLIARLDRAAQVSKHACVVHALVNLFEPALTHGEVQRLLATTDMGAPWRVGYRGVYDSLLKGSSIVNGVAMAAAAA